MPWLQLAADVTPVASATSSIVTYILGYGPIGIIALAFAFRFVEPRGAIERARKEARTDLLKENERLIAEKRDAEEQRDTALKLAQDQIVPLLLSFNSSVSALLPVLQDLVRRHEQPP